MHTRNQQNRNLIVGFGMLLGGFLLGCPPAAKTPDQKQEKANAAGEGEANAAGEEPAEKLDEKPAAPAPVPPPSGGW